jgi:hypothetical protein
MNERSSCTFIVPTVPPQTLAVGLILSALKRGEELTPQTAAAAVAFSYTDSAASTPIAAVVDMSLSSSAQGNI